MGYYSDAALAVNESAYLEMLKGAWEKDAADDGCRARFLTKDCSISKSLLTYGDGSTESVIIMRWDEIRWHESMFSEVKYVSDWMNGEYGDLKYAFARIGKDYRDVETSYSYDGDLWDLYIQREILVDARQESYTPPDPPEKDDPIEAMDDVSFFELMNAVIDPGD